MPQQPKVVYVTFKDASSADVALHLHKVWYGALVFFPSLNYHLATFSSGYIFCFHAERVCTFLHGDCYVYMPAFRFLMMYYI